MNRIDTCQTCGRQIVWLEHVISKNKAPIEYAPPAEKGNVVVIDREGYPTLIETAVAYRIKKKSEEWNPADGPLWINHFANCKDGPHWRDTKRGKAEAQEKALEKDAMREMGDERDPEDAA